MSAFAQASGAAQREYLRVNDRMQHSTRNMRRQASRKEHSRIRAHHSAARTSQASRQHCSPPAVGAVVNGESRVGIAMGSSSSPSDGVSRSTGMRSMGAGGSAGTQLARHEHPEGAKSLQKPTHESEGAVGEAEGRGVARVGDLVGDTLGDLVGDVGASVGRRGLTGASVGRVGGSTGK